MKKLLNVILFSTSIFYSAQTYQFNFIVKDKAFSGMGGARSFAYDSDNHVKLEFYEHNNIKYGVVVDREHNFRHIFRLFENKNHVKTTYLHTNNFGKPTINDNSENYLDYVTIKEMGNLNYEISIYTDLEKKNLYYRSEVLLEESAYDYFTTNYENTQSVIVKNELYKSLDPNKKYSIKKLIRTYPDRMKFTFDYKKEYYTLQLPKKLIFKEGFLAD